MPRRVTDDEVAAIPGWFPALDLTVFRFFLEEQARRGVGGDLAELGTYLGSSAVVIGSYRRPGETLTVVDLFEDVPADAANASEHARWYGELSQAAFERNFRRVHDELPVIIRGPSTAIRSAARAGAHRFVHVDASHVHRHVVEDVATARLLVAPLGVVAFDDFRAEHSPGVAAAVWPAMNQGLLPLLLTPSKLYASWDDSAWWPKTIREWLPSSGLAWEMHDIAGHEVAQVWQPSARVVGWIPPALLPAAVRWRRRAQTAWSKRRRGGGVADGQ